MRSSPSPKPSEYLPASPRVVASAFNGGQYSVRAQRLPRGARQALTETGGALCRPLSVSVSVWVQENMA
jgi:hypothetical protein